MSTSICPVCLEIYTKKGNGCPKLLPCTHTVCVLCLRNLLSKCQVQCPECRLHHQVPSQGVPAFPTNRYVLENIELAQGKVNSEERDLDSPTNESKNEGNHTSSPQDDTTTETCFDGVFIPGRLHQETQVHPQIAQDNSQWSEKRCQWPWWVKVLAMVFTFLFCAALTGFFVYIFAHKQ